MNDQFVGKWELREASYESGQPPSEGMYSIEHHEDGYRVIMRWITADGEPMEAEYVAVPDGKQYLLDNPAVEESTMSMVRVDEYTLDSTVIQNGDIVAYARRVLSEDGSTMTVTQAGPTPDGTTFNNVAIYARVSE